MVFVQKCSREGWWQSFSREIAWQALIDTWQGDRRTLFDLFVILRFCSSDMFRMGNVRAGRAGANRIS
jgi:hypothetical protein